MGCRDDLWPDFIGIRRLNALTYLDRAETVEGVLVENFVGVNEATAEEKPAYSGFLEDYAGFVDQPAGWGRSAIPLAPGAPRAL